MTGAAEAYITDDPEAECDDVKPDVDVACCDGTGDDADESDERGRVVDGGVEMTTGVLLMVIIDGLIVVTTVLAPPLPPPPWF